MDPKREIQLNSDLTRIAVCIMQAVFFAPDLKSTFIFVGERIEKFRKNLPQVGE
jgi:hypothetical protein